ncbi:MAG TPA: sialidase family protein, partial [Candidatus Polarisedimenticolaceae bacterium]
MRVLRSAVALFGVSVVAASLPARSAAFGEAARAQPPRRVSSADTAVAGGTDAAPFTNLAIAEIPIAAALPTVGNRDLVPRVFGLATGEIAVLGLDDFRLWSKTSVNGGVTFGSEVAVGGAGVPDTHDFDARLSADGKLYVAMLVVGTAGGIELRTTRSDDMGATWTPPVVVVAEGSEAFSVFRVRLATGPAGRAAVLLQGHDGTRLYVCATIDSGATWTSPSRIDSGAPAGAYFPPYGGTMDVAVDNSNRILAAFAQNRGGGNTVFFTRSTDDGATFAAETAVALASHGNSASPDLEIANDGNGLLALWDDAGNDHVYVLRSTTGGSSWTTVLDRLAASDTNIPLVPRIVADPATATTFLLYADMNSAVSLSRSANSGLTWGAAVSLAGAVAGNGFDRPFGRIEMKRTTTNTWVVAWEDRRTDTYAQLRTDVYARASSTDGTSFGAEVRVDAGSTAGSSASEFGGMTAHSANNVYLVYADGRDESGRSTNVYGNRSTVPLAFAADVRLDTDAATRQPSSGWDRTVAADGGTHAYVAFRSRTAGPFADIYVAASSDSGQSFGSPVRVGNTTAGSRINVGPVLRAFPDGRVYLAYTSDNGTALEIRFNRSTDFGATWQAADVVIATPPRTGIDYDNPQDAQRLEATADGTVYVAWSGDNNVKLRKSSDFGVTWGTETDVDQSSLFCA